METRGRGWCLPGWGVGRWGRVPGPCSLSLVPCLSNACCLLPITRASEDRAGPGAEESAGDATVVTVAVMTLGAAPARWAAADGGTSAQQRQPWCHRGDLGPRCCGQAQSSAVPGRQVGPRKGQEGEREAPGARRPGWGATGDSDWAPNTVTRPQQSTWPPCSWWLCHMRDMETGRALRARQASGHVCSAGWACAPVPTLRDRRPQVRPALPFWYL